MQHRKHFASAVPLALGLVLNACGGSPPTAAVQPAAAPSAPSSVPQTPAAVTSAVAPASAPPPETVAVDTPLTTRRGTTWPVAAGWTITRAPLVPDASDEYIVLQDPERAVNVVLFETADKTPAEAIAAAWQRYRPGFDLKPLNTVRPPPREWDEIEQTVYQSPSGSTRVAVGVARRKGTQLWVNLIEGEQAVFERRGAQIQNTFSHMKAPGVAEETWAGRQPLPLEGDRQAAFARFVAQTREALEVPGAAVAVVQGGRVVFAQGFGLGRLGGRPRKADTVTPDTLFLIGSTTKSLSTLLMARAVDEGLFTWDTPVKQVYPAFALGDAALTEKLTMKHLVCACTGLPRADMELLFSFDGVTPAKLLDSMKALKPTTGFGETFQYNNQLVAAGGYLAAHAFHPKMELGAAYDKALKEKVLGPLGMTRSTPVMAEARKLGLVTSHGDDIDGTLLPLPPNDENFVVPLRPSGGVASTAEDMAKYLLAELARGKSVTGQQVASEANVLLRRTPQIKIGEETGYGLGLSAGTHKGRAVVEHGGATFGQFTTFFLMPDADLGLVVLTNGPGPLGSLTRARLLELVFDGEPVAEKTLAFALEEKKKAQARLTERLAPPEPPEVLAALVGHYRDEALGELRLTLKRGGLIVDAGEWQSRAGWQKRTDGAPPDLILLDPPVAGLPFERVKIDGAPALRLAFGQHVYTFARRKAK